MRYSGTRTRILSAASFNRSLIPPDRARAGDPGLIAGDDRGLAPERSVRGQLVGGASAADGDSRIQDGSRRNSTSGNPFDESTVG